MEAMTRTQQATARRIVEAAIDLMSKRGFHRVSVQEIGDKAGLCEKTVFRYFATKKALLDAIIQYREYASEMKEHFAKQRTWNLSHDLELAARLYFQATRTKRNAFRAYLSALDSVDTNGEDFMRDPHELLDFIHGYITEMQLRGQVREGNGELMARAFINTLHGYMLMYCLNDQPETWQNKVESMKLTIRLFIQGFATEAEQVQAS